MWSETMTVVGEPASNILIDVESGRSCGALRHLAYAGSHLCAEVAKVGIFIRPNEPRLLRAPEPTESFARLSFAYRTCRLDR